MQNMYTFISGGLIAPLGGLIGLGGGESHLPKRSEGVHYPGDRPGRFVEQLRLFCDFNNSQRVPS